MQRHLLMVVLLGLILMGATASLQAQDEEPAASDATLYLPLVAEQAASGPVDEDPDGVDQPAEAETDELPSLIVHIAFTTPSQLQDLLEEFDVLEQPTRDHYVTALVSQQSFERLQEEDYQVEIDQAQTDRLHIALAQIRAAQARAEASTSSIPGYACYRTVEETYSSLAALAAAHPQLATWTDIGDSWEKATPGGEAGYDIYALKLTNQAIAGPKPKFLLMAAIHAREYTTAELATRFAEELVAKYNVDPDVTWLLDYFEIHIIPQVNPDGRKIAENGQLWRKNTDRDDGCNASYAWGTDLNRNSSFQWNMGGSSSNACSDTYHGPSAASEPETQAVEHYAAAIFPDQRGPAITDPAPADAEGVFITLHSYSELVLFPWGYTTDPAPNKTALETLGRKFGYFNGYQVCTGPACLYGTSGTTDDYTYGELGVASYTFEMGQNFFEQCSFFESNILPKNMPALYYAAKAARRPYQNPAGPDVLNVTLSAPNVTLGTPVKLTATINDTRYNSNGWGNEPTQAIQAARYTLDGPSWNDNAITMPLQATDGAFDSAVEGVAATIVTTGLTLGRHLILVEGQDSAGHWGVMSSAFLTVTAANATPTATPTITPMPTLTPRATPSPTPTATPTALPTGAVVYVSSTTGGSVGGVAFADEDILAYHVDSDTWSMYFDGSDVGITVDVDAFTLLADGAILFSVDMAATLPDIGAIDDADVVRFVPTTLGEATSGVFELYFDGSDVGLTANTEDVDGIGLAPDGRLLLSTLGVYGVTGVAGADEDILAFAPTTLGETTSGAWSLYFDGSDVGLADAISEDVRGIWVDGTSGKLYLSTAGAFSVNGAAGGGADIFTCTPVSLGNTTTCTFGPGLYWEGSAHGFGSESLDGMSIAQ
ncbi:MAG: M14 family metallopeptidase [Caldilineaceae bacterium]